ncbi:MAG: hypothetical protein AB7I30_21015, partial [Isosphaeraceae bacterium]
MPNNPGDRRSAEPSASALPIVNGLGVPAFDSSSWAQASLAPAPSEAEALANPGLRIVFDVVAAESESPWTVEVGSSPGSCGERWVAAPSRADGPDEGPGVPAVLAPPRPSAPPVSSRQENPDEVAGPTRGAGSTFLRWVTLVVVLNSVLWFTGVREAALKEAVERGVTRVELRMVHEARESAARKAIKAQRESLRFWTTLALLVDFVFEPLSLVIRATLVATTLSALAALFGRPIDYSRALDDCARDQGYWVLGLGVHVALLVWLCVGDVDTSVAQFLTPGLHRAPIWSLCRQMELFALWGWAVLALGGWRRGQVNMLTAVFSVGFLAAIELTTR